MYHEESYTLTYASSSGHALSQYDYLFFVPASSSSCPASGPSTNGGYLNANSQITVQLSAAQSPYALCVREGLDGSAPVTLHAHITAVVSYRSPSSPPPPPQPPPSPPPPSPPPPPPPMPPPPSDPPPSPPPATPPSPTPPPPSPPPPDGTCNPTSELTAVVSKMNEHAAFNSTHGAVANQYLTSAFFNGCAATCALACKSSNPDIDDDVPIYYCERNDETGVALAYPRCAAACTTAALATSCTGLCATGTYCCASTGGSCIPLGETCPCPDCATPLDDGHCEESDPSYFEVETGGSATKCCAPSPPTPPLPPSSAPMDPPLPPLTARYHVVQGTTCEEHGYFDILDNSECNVAATSLVLPDTSVCATCPTANGNFPNG